MCLIIYKPKESKVSIQALESAFKKNDDGWGMMRVSNNGDSIYVEKGLKNFDHFIWLYKNRFEDYECAIHFRSATQGEVSIVQSHPYKISNKAWLMHNGNIDSLPHIAKPSQSDSYNFALTIKDMVKEGWLASEEYKSILEAAIGFNNRCVILDSYLGFVFLNKEAGREYKGAWYSNTYAWDLPFELVQEINYEKKKSEEAKKKAQIVKQESQKQITSITTPSFEYSKEDKEFYKKGSNEEEDESIQFFAYHILHGNLPLEILDESDLKDKTEAVLQRISEIKTQEKEKLATNDSCCPTNGFGIPNLPQTLIEYSKLDLSDFKEIAFQYPEEMATHFFDLVNG